MTAQQHQAVIPAHTMPGSPPNPNTASNTRGTQSGTNRLEARPGSRADRMAQPLTRDVLTALAEHHGVCVRPTAIRRIDKATGETTIMDVPCGARLASKCKPCAERNRRLRQQQIREGWHLAEEPMPALELPSDEVKAAILLRCSFAFDRDECLRTGRWDQVAELDQAITELDEQLATMRVRGKLAVPAENTTGRRARSTKRREDATDLPRLPVDARTVGKTYQAKDGKTFQPSMLLTITLPGHGAVHSGPRTRRGQLIPCECGALHGQKDPLLGTPIDPAEYDYRRAACDAIFFAAGLDRFWQNLRRAAGWNVQYAGAVEMQKRLAPHAHLAMRGTLPKALLRKVVEATYHQVWWPQFDTMIYSVEKPPVWDEIQEAYVDPKSGLALKTWSDALDQIDADAEPAYVLRLGRIDPRGITPGTKDAERSIRYVTKYVTKDLTEHADPRSGAQRAHFDRLYDELSTLPCSPTCANWLLNGVQPDKVKKGLIPGRCSGKVHQRPSLGFTGRRVLISRQWSGKTLADHRGDQRDWVRTVLSGALADQDGQDEDANDGQHFTYQLARADEPDVPPLQIRIMHAIAIRERQKAALRQALAPPGPVPATGLERDRKAEASVRAGKHHRGPDPS